MNGHRRIKRGRIAHVRLDEASLLRPKCPVRYWALYVGSGSNGRLLGTGAPFRCLHHDGNKNERTATVGQFPYVWEGRARKLRADNSDLDLLGNGKRIVNLNPARYYSGQPCERSAIGTFCCAAQTPRCPLAKLKPTC